MMQSPFSLLHTQISHTCWFAFDRGVSLPPAAFLLARLSQQLAASSVPPPALQDFSAAEIPSRFKSYSDSHLPMCLLAEMGSSLPCVCPG